VSYLLSRLAAGLFQLAAVSLIAALLFSAAPGDFYSTEQLNTQTSSTSLAEWRKAQGLDRSWLSRYAAWLESSLHGDFGISLAYQMPVARLLTPRLAATARIALPALLASWLIGLAAALAAARIRALLSPAEAAATILALLPDLITASALIWIAVWLRSSLDGPALPTAALTVVLTPVIFLHASRSLTSATALPFFRIAARRPIPPAQLWLRYLLPAAANPLISLAGLSIAGSVSSALIIEAITGWPGVGPLFLEAIHARDFTIVQTVIVFLSALLIASNLAADLLLFYTDPRIRLPHEDQR
jgi:peptide/nickel transport system permease protein